MKKTYKTLLAGLLVGMMAGPYAWVDSRAAASGNYTDLLPVGAAGNTTVISNGSGWSLTTLPPTQTFGDALSRTVDTLWQSTGSLAIANTTAVSSFTAIGTNGVGSTTFPVGWVASGRSIRITVKGKYGTTGTPNWTWAIFLGTTSILTTGAQAAPTTVTGQPFTAQATISINTTGNAGTVSGVYDILTTTASAPTPNGSNTVSYSTAVTGVTVDLTSQLTVNPAFTWGTANAANTITPIITSIEFLN